MTVAIASGKGGTGKTTCAVNLAYALASRGECVRLLDCDVEEPDDHLFVQPGFTERSDVTVPKPVVDAEACTGCGRCADSCNYHAMAVVKGNVLIFNELCHSCGVCSYVCPEDAISEEDVVIGVREIADEGPFFFGHGMLQVGEALAPTVVRSVKECVDPEAINIIDAAPGTACPVVEAVQDADAALLVTEPTPFGLHDLRLAVGLSLKLGIPTGIIINRSDGEDRLITEYSRESGVPIAGRIPFDRRYAEAYSNGEMVAARFPELAENLLGIFDRMHTVTPPVPEEREIEVSGEMSPGPNGSDGGHREVTVISGKGGTGKTTLVGSFAHLASHQVLADNDVDASDLHLLLRPEVHEAHEFVGGTKATVEADRCIGCGVCAEACRFDAIRPDGPGNAVTGATYRVEPLACEGCGLCPMVCPSDAITGRRNVTGMWFVSRTDFGPMVHARLGIAEENSGRLVSEVRRRAAGIAAETGARSLIADGPPGTGCPVIASVSGTDLIVVVTEPTVAGHHDLVRVLDLAEHFGIQAVVVINKADLNEVQAARIEETAASRGTRVIGRVPFDTEVHRSLMAGRAVVDYGDGDAAQAIRRIWSTIETQLHEGTGTEDTINAEETHV